MCGIIAVLRRKTRRQAPKPEQIQQCLAQAKTAMLASADMTTRLQAWQDTAGHLHQANQLLLGAAGLSCLLQHPELQQELGGCMQELQDQVNGQEQELDQADGDITDELEALNAALVDLNDKIWALRRDRLRTADTVTYLGGSKLSASAMESYHSITVALSALDRLEVRGRDSAGIHILVSGHGLDLDSKEMQEQLQHRLENRLFTNGAVRQADGQLCFIYKAAAEIGELGDNGKALRQAIRSDKILAKALAAEAAEAVVLCHTRWASVGIVSQANAHPVNHEETDREGPYVTAVLNGDVDNFAELAKAAELQLATEITTDAKVIPSLVSRRLAEGEELTEAFRQSVSSFMGSVAISSHTAVAPGKMHLALRGSGQGVYVGLTEDSFIVASEPYGVVEETQSYLRLDGETPGNPDNPTASQGQILVLDREYAGELQGMQRLAYDGTALPIAADELQEAEITTRDIDRGDNPHFLLKEVSEAPRSFHKTLRGKIQTVGDKLRVQLGDETLPQIVRENLRSGHYRRILVIGQGTAAVAGQGVAAAMQEALKSTELQVQALPATELSGFHLLDDMSHCLVVAISQSGTTTDTNRTVDLVRGRGAAVLAIVNRRNSDLTDKSDGVLYTSDGRDVEMSVASTKAFYSQIAAGFLLAFAIQQEIQPKENAQRQDILAALKTLPQTMREVLSLQDDIQQAAAKHAPRRRYWAVVGNGKNRIAAAEIRIKLSELCYKSIACDATEDKKHIDLSSEPLILVCGAGLTGSTADDVAKELAIYQAHKAAPILIASQDSRDFPAALDTIRVPAVHPSLAFIMSTMAGHLFGYYAALAIDALANPLRLARSAIESKASACDDAETLLRQLEPDLQTCCTEFFKGLRDEQYNGQLEASTAVHMASLLQYALGTKPLESYQIEMGQVGTPSVLVEELTQALSKAIDELTRPVDAIKHQAKTVTVGISRSDEALLTVPLVRSLLEAGATRERIAYRDLRTLAALDPAVAEVSGATRYAISGDVRNNGATIKVVGSTGIAAHIPSRTAQDNRLRGTKHLVASERQTWIARGRSDDRTVVLVPEVQAGQCVGLTLLHVQFQDHISATAMRDVLSGYRNRYSALRDLVTETDPTFRDEVLAEIPVAEMMTTPVHILADRWRITQKG